MASTLSSAQILQLATDFSSLADSVRDILMDPDMTLSPAASNVLSSDLTSLSNIAANLATWSALCSFANSDDAFAKLSKATDDANQKVAELEKTVAKINSIVNIVGSAISLGVAFGTGNVIGIIGDAGNLETAVVNA